MSSQVHAILRRKGSNVISIQANATVYEAIKKMVHHNVGSILAMEGESIAGIFTERDYLRRIALEGRTSKTTKVQEVMTSDIETVSPADSVEECMVLMTEKKCRHLPVMEDEVLKGIISIGDCVKQISRGAQAEVEHMKGYISGEYPK